MISPEEALQTILNVAQRLPPVDVLIHDALDKVLAGDIRAPDPLPPYRASIKVPYCAPLLLSPVRCCWYLPFLLM